MKILRSCLENSEGGWSGRQGYRSRCSLFRSLAQKNASRFSSLRSLHDLRLVTRLSASPPPLAHEKMQALFRFATLRELARKFNSPLRGQIKSATSGVVVLSKIIAPLRFASPFVRSEK